MPREHRKRGKKHKKQNEELSHEPQQSRSLPAHDTPQGTEPGPSWIVSQSSEFNAEAPFGYVDSEVKAYFRTVDTQIREWQVAGHPTPDEEGTDPNEDRRLFFVAALTEMSGKEKELSTDPDCSNILERMAYSMDDFARRVFLDRLTGSYKILVKHRFASHVCQTFIEVASDTINRERKNIIPPSSGSPDEGELPLMQDLILDASEELLPELPSLMMDPFASHVLRTLLAVFVPDLFSSDHKSTIRSRRSAAHKARQGPRTSVFTSDSTRESNTPTKLVPLEYKAQAGKFVTGLRQALGGNEVRALAASPVASPLLQMLLEIETHLDLALSPDSLADRVLDGLISRIDHTDDDLPASDYVGTLLRDPTSSHLLETLVARLPDHIFTVIWKTYFVGKLARLAVHPVANFVVAKGLERASADQLREALAEIEGAVAEKLYKSSRTGIFRAIVERAGSLRSSEAAVLKLIASAAGIDMADPEDVNLLVPCLLRVTTSEEYRKLVQAQSVIAQKPTEAAKHTRREHGEQSENPSTIKTQGAILLQAILKLPSPHHQSVLDSIFAQPLDDLLTMAHDVTSSRVLDVVLQSPTVPFKEKRRFVMHFIGHYHTLVDDRIGSRVGDNCWAFADPYLREKIAQSLIHHERTLAGSFYGKFFARNLNLYLLKKDPEQWKSAQAKSRAAGSTQADHSAVLNKPSPTKAATAAPSSDPPAEPSAPVTDKKRSKRKHRGEDEIDQLFEESLGKKVKKAALERKTLDDEHHGEENKAGDVAGKKRKKHKADGERDGLQDVLGAIKAAPKGEEVRRPKK